MRHWSHFANRYGFKLFLREILFILKTSSRTEPKQIVSLKLFLSSAQEKTCPHKFEGCFAKSSFTGSSSSWKRGNICYGIAEGCTRNHHHDHWSRI
mmetsp:Transcript_3968/g.7062  ORF Transcript_3968/g.7062 Transcript_3968/m.7062 type:complete len:96 (-) Transcript_3968:723-1010(-)